MSPLVTRLAGFDDSVPFARLPSAGSSETLRALGSRRARPAGETVKVSPHRGRAAGRTVGKVEGHPQQGRGVARTPGTAGPWVCGQAGTAGAGAGTGPRELSVGRRR